ncbi:MAG TPA: EamA family transporter [Desulfovibrio sp.]|nr:EamA family transporter [Desulfovibrio sp.]
MTGYLLVLLAASLWALIGPLARFCMDEGLSPPEIALWRAAFGALFFALHAWRCGLWRVDPRHGAAMSAFGIVGVGVLFGSYQYAVQEGGAALAAVLLYTAPAWVAVLSRLLLHEPLTRRKLAALMVAMTGAVLTCLSGGGLSGGASTAGIVAGLISGFAYSLHYIFSAHWMRRYSPVTLYLYCLPAGVATLVPFTTFTHKTPTAWLLLVAIGLLTTYCAYFVYCEGIRRLAPTRVAIVANLEPVLAALLAYLWWGELFPPLGWLGAGLVLTAVFLIVLDRSETPQVPPHSTKPE